VSRLRIEDEKGGEPFNFDITLKRESPHTCLAIYVTIIQQLPPQLSME